MMYSMISPVGPWTSAFYIIPFIIVTNLFLYNFTCSMILDAFGVIAVYDNKYEIQEIKAKYAQEIVTQESSVDDD